MTRPLRPALLPTPKRPDALPPLRQILLPLLLIATVCEAQETRELARQRERVYDVTSGDPEMNAAIARARATLHVFNGYVERAREDGLDPRLKAAFRQGDKIEYMWVGNLTFDGRVYRGSCGTARTASPTCAWATR